MSKEELEKAIENGESVWYADFDFNVIECVLIPKNKPELKKPNYLYCYAGNEYEYRRKLHIDRIFNTKAEAEHYLHHANITRTETLPYHDWNERNSIIFSFYSPNNKGNRQYEFRLFKSGNITIWRTDDMYKVFNEPATEENFYKAYDECVKLFKGCEDE